MHPYCIYVFDSSTANEAALAVKEGQFESIIHYHNNKHKPMQGPHPPPQSMQPPPQTHNMMAGPPSYAPPPHHHVSPPNHMQQHQHSMGPGVPPPPGPLQPMQQQPYDPNLSPQKMKERESKLNRIGHLAQITQPPPPSMHQMTPAAQRVAQGPPPQAQAQQQPPPPPPQQQQQQAPQQTIKQEQHMDPLSSMAAMSECPNMDSYGHTIHHHPPS